MTLLTQLSFKCLWHALHLTLHCLLSCTNGTHMSTICLQSWKRLSMPWRTTAVVKGWSMTSLKHPFGRTTSNQSVRLVVENPHKPPLVRLLSQRPSSWYAKCQYWLHRSKDHCYNSNTLFPARSSLKFTGKTVFAQTHADNNNKVHRHLLRTASQLMLCCALQAHYTDQDCKAWHLALCHFCSQNDGYGI